MQAEVSPIPEGYHSLTPYLITKNASEAIEFYKKAFGAIEKFRMADPSGKVSHSELQIGDSVVMMADEFPEMGAVAPSEGGRAFSLLLYVEDVDKMFERAVAAGAKVVRPLKNEFYGDRMGTLKDPFGHQWYLATHFEDVSAEEMKARSQKN